MLTDPSQKKKKFRGPELRSLTVQMVHTPLQVPGDQAIHCNKSNYPVTSGVSGLQVKLIYHPNGGCREVSALNSEGCFLPAGTPMSMSPKEMAWTLFQTLKRSKRSFHVKNYFAGGKN